LLRTTASIFFWRDTSVDRCAGAAAKKSCRKMGTRDTWCAQAHTHINTDLPLKETLRQRRRRGRKRRRRRRATPSPWKIIGGYFPTGSQWNASHVGFPTISRVLHFRTKVGALHRPAVSLFLYLSARDFVVYLQREFP
jgi:hypothetical protein